MTYRDDESRRSCIEVKYLNGDEVRYIPDSPELRALRKRMEMGIKVLDMRKRFLFFFKRKLTPNEKAIELLKLQMEEMKDGPESKST